MRNKKRRFRASFFVVSLCGHLAIQPLGYLALWLACHSAILPFRRPAVPHAGQVRQPRQTRLRYSWVRVSISILSPVATKMGTGTSKPVASLAGFMILPEVSPLTAGSV